MSGFEALGQQCNLVCGLQLQQRQEQEERSARDAAARMGLQLGSLSRVHTRFTWDPATSTRVAVSDGNLTALRTDSYSGILFSERPLTQPAYVEIEVTVMQTSWSGHLELGLTGARSKCSGSNISALGRPTVYFRPVDPKATVDGTSVAVSPSSEPVPTARMKVGVRFGVLYDNDSLTLYVRHDSGSPTSELVRWGQVPVSFSMRAYLVLNLYGQTAGARAVNPST